MSEAAASGKAALQEQPRPTILDAFAGIIEDAYQAECEQFDAEMERVDGDAYACLYDLKRAATGMPRIRALADRLVEAGEAAAQVRNRGFFLAGFEAGLEIAVMAGLGRR